MCCLMMHFTLIKVNSPSPLNVPINSQVMGTLNGIYTTGIILKFTNWKYFKTLYTTVDESYSIS